MSQSLIIFDTSGKVYYQYNNKINPFNEFISSIVNETQLIELDVNYLTKVINNKRFYSYKKANVYIALYFDAITTLDSEKIKQSFLEMLKVFNKLKQEDDNDEGNNKLKGILDYQFNQLMKLKQQEVATPTSVIDSANTSGTVTPRRGAMAAAAAAAHKGSSKKKMRKWDGEEMVDYSDDQATALDYSKLNNNQSNDNLTSKSEQMKIDDDAFIKDNGLVLVNELNEILNESDEEDDQTTQQQQESTKVSGFFSKITSYLGGSINLEDVSKQFNDHLISKNIAPQTSRIIIEKIKSKLSNQKHITLAIYKQTLIEELTKILTPNVSTDLLHDIKRRSIPGSRPYVISVVGVNGVGKSTNLAKLAYWFLQNNLNVLICACDTFRSGAVEQLKVHVNNLTKLNESSTTTTSKIDIFEKGYGSGDHVVQTAKSAIEYAEANQFQIVLIDTAGRTHSNTKLMAPLKKFGDAANPDKIIMVGEALVGTDSVEQAINFNNAFGNKRNLDFFIISKVDTVGDLVGAMINMVMATKVPILFVGTGQTYTDIKRLSVKQVVEMLMR
ncbi:SRP101 [[Candida] subhashii]|uniref:Signal recognition particle receptor subunit alpha homolog n=1 Tax=[Candida] subhashii TaxID=561895 RepID=A0A8J5USC9_9ASCO|nr:SRP101 [[Candida] subhashii]KAG7666286.1 SRP101 [[Candida] subhashii]